MNALHMKKGLLIAACSFFLLLSSLPYAKAGTFPDVPEDSIYYKPVEYFAALKVIQGYTDEDSGEVTFKPDQNVNRAEAVKIILAGATRQFELQRTLSSDVFPDVKADQWFAPFVKKAKEAGIVKGNDDTGLFTPARTVNKAELLKMTIMANQVNLDGVLQEVKDVPSSDVSLSDWYYPYMLYGKEFGIIFPDTFGKLNPGKELTRGEVVEIMYNMIKVIKGGYTQELLSRTEAKIFSAITLVNLSKYDKALADIKKAQEFAERALLESPSETIVKEAKLVTDAFALALEGFKLWKQDNKITEAQQKAQQAEEKISSISFLTDLKASLTTMIDALKSAE